jgi:hypothetical protein
MQRTTITETQLGRMFPSSIDRLWPDGTDPVAEHNGRRMCWVGFGWVDEGPADGTEPLLIMQGKIKK